MLIDKKGRRYDLVAPEGGWGYIVTVGISIVFSVTIVPICVFGLVFGSFLANVGDETSGITLVNGIFNSVLSFTGLIANQLLQKYSCRKVGLIGGIIFFLGSLATAFVQNLFQLIITFGLLQGLGFGLIMPAGFTSFNGYFDKRQNAVMGLCQALIVAITIGWPMITKKLLDAFGWRGTQLIFAGLSLNTIPCMLTLQPVKWHMKKEYVTNIEMKNTSSDQENNANGSLKEGETPLLDKKTFSHLHNVLEKRKSSLISIGSMAASVSSVNIQSKTHEPKSLWKTVYDALDLSLLKDPTYVNIALGLSLSLTSDLAFLSLLPMILRNANYSPEQTTLVMTVYFCSDLACRLVLSFVSAICKVRNRYVFLGGSLLSAVFRTAFIMDDSLNWVLFTCAVLGFLRCLIQTPLPLVVSEQYGQRFSTAFTLYMVVCGVVASIFGPLIGFVKEVAQSDTMVIHLLTMAYLVCGISWSIELISARCKNSNQMQEN